jgi:predicted ArsR family transcriptional regulator
MNDRKDRSRVCLLIAALQDEPQTVESLRDASGFHPNCVRNWLNEFKAADLVTVSDSERSGRGAAPRLYAWRFA